MNKPIDPNGHPRPELYTLAHRALPGISFVNPFAILSAAAAKCYEGSEFFVPVFEQIQMKDTNLAMAQYLPECALELRQIRGCPVIIFKLPTPKYPAEAFLTGFFANVDLQNISPELSADKCRYFTMEAGWDLIKEMPYATFCEWTSKNDHLNYGEQPIWDGSTSSFLTLIDQVIGTRENSDCRD